jgi:hypothetical protein
MLAVTTATRASQSVMSYLRTTMQRRLGAVRIGPFLASFDADSVSPYRNYAVPEDGAQPTAAELDALVEGFAHISRRV